MAEIVLTAQDLVGGLPGLAQKLTGNAGNAYALQRSNKLDEYAPLVEGQKLQVPDNMMLATKPALNPFAVKIADSFPRNRISVEGLPENANAIKILENQPFMDLSRQAAEQLFNPYFDRKKTQAERGYATQEAQTVGNARDAFNERNTLNSSFAFNTIGQAKAAIDDSRTEGLGDLEDNRKLAIGQEISSRVLNEQQKIDLLANQLAKETLNPLNPSGITREDVVGNLDERLQTFFNERDARDRQIVSQLFSALPPMTTSPTGTTPVTTTQGGGIPTSAPTEVPAGTAKLEDFPAFNAILEEAQTNPVAQAVYNYFAERHGDRIGKKMVVLTKGESGWREDAANAGSGEYSYGPFQINLDAHNDKVARYTGTTDYNANGQWLSNLGNSLLIADEIFQNSGFAPWTFAHAGIPTYAGIVGNQVANLADIY